MTYTVKIRRRYFPNLPLHDLAERFLGGRDEYVHWIRVTKRLSLVWETKREVPGDVFGDDDGE